MNAERYLYVIPVAHSAADMGSLWDQMPISEEYEAAVTKYWVEVGRFVRDTFINGDINVNKVYQDGLSDVSEEDVAKVVTQAQTANYEILRWLKTQGALIRGTEDHALLLKEHQNLAILSGLPQDEDAWLEAKLAYAQVLGERDIYIAQRIREDLLPGETGVLFIGAAHQVTPLLEEEIPILKLEQLNQPFAQTLRAHAQIGTNYSKTKRP